MLSGAPEQWTFWRDLEMHRSRFGVAQLRMWYQVHDEPLSPTRNLLPDYGTRSYNVYILFLSIFLYGSQW